MRLICACGHDYAAHAGPVTDPQPCRSIGCDCRCFEQYAPEPLPGLAAFACAAGAALGEADRIARDACNCEQSRALLKGRADLAHAITSVMQRGALITIGPFGGGDDAAIRVAIDYRGNLITGTMVDPFEALALALAQWVRVHG